MDSHQFILGPSVSPVLDFDLHEDCIFVLSYLVEYVTAALHIFGI